MTVQNDTPLHLAAMLTLCRPDVLPPSWQAGAANHPRIKVVRHAGGEWDLSQLHSPGLFAEYQARQLSPVFEGADLIVSLLGDGGSRCVFLGVYSVDGVSENPPPYPPGWPFPGMHVGVVRYALTQLDGFNSLKSRLVVDWGLGARSWVQWLSPARPKRVIELLPIGHARTFPGYERVTLMYGEVRTIVDHPDANRAWHRALSAVAGVYLITDTRSGEQYVGSAHGAEGILGRWTAYAKTGHGGNVRIDALLAANPERIRDFQFSILQTLPRSMTKNEVIAMESLWKGKLGTRAFGLNAN